MNDIQKIAIENFRSGLNCAQSVLAAFSDKYNVDKSTAVMISCGFGAGMGRLQETCGAVTGAYMVFGLDVCSKVTDNKNRKEKTYKMIRDFDHQFKQLYGTTSCSDLLKIDLKTPEGQHLFHEKRLNEEVCEKCISDAVLLALNSIGKMQL
jgi:C_GCAxxG_C_C family probable redox protein